MISLIMPTRVGTPSINGDLRFLGIVSTVGANQTVWPELPTAQVLLCPRVKFAAVKKQSGALWEQWRDTRRILTWQ